MKRAWLKAGAIVGGWSLLATIWAVNAHARQVMTGHADAFAPRLWHSLLDYWIYAALTPFVFWAAGRFRFQRGRIVRSLLIHAGFLLLFSCSHLLVSSLLQLTNTRILDFDADSLRALVLNLDNDLWMYWPLVVIWNLIEYYRRYHERDVIAERLQTQLAQAQLDLLKAQIHPHFLFNTLNSIASLMHDDVNAADDMVADLSYMLRQSLDIRSDQEIPLEHELELLEAYVRIQKRRFEEKLQVSIDVTPGIRDAMVPAFLCQPLVENAIRHGMNDRLKAGVIQVSGYQRDGSIVLQVRDNGCGLQENYKEGIGLSNIRKRLEQLYGARQSMELETNRDGGVTVTLTLPLHAGWKPTEDTDHDSNHHRGRRTTGAPAHSLSAEK